ncbi:MAG: Hint domain-containing protein [Pseudomonadota bacterium]
MVTHTNQALFLGNFTDFDSDNGADMVGTTVGSSDSPIFENNLSTITHDDIGGDGTAFESEGDTVTYSIDGGSEITSGFDNVAVITGTLNYTDGTPPFTGQFIVDQAQDGSVFLVSFSDPNNSSNLALQEAPIESFEIQSVDFFSPSSGDTLPNAPLTFACFVAGTLIEADGGCQVRIEDLSVGDLVRTQGHGLRPIRWIGRRRLSPIDLITAPQLLPIRIRKGALGAGLPSRDLCVSPQHRMLVRSRIAQRMFGSGEVLVPAKKLLGLPGIEIAGETRSVTYLHLLLDRHEVIFAEDAPTESLLTGPQALKTLGQEACDEIHKIFPELGRGETLPEPARPIPAGKALTRLAERHLRNRKPLLSPVE